MPGRNPFSGHNFQMVRHLILLVALNLTVALAPSSLVWADEALSAVQEEQWTIGINLNDTVRLGALLQEHLRAKGEPDARNRKGKTALMAAAAGKDLPLFKRLLEAGADPAAVNVKGASTLIYAAWGGNTGIIQILLAKAVPLEQAASNGWTAVMMAAAKGHQDTLALLLAAGAQADSRDVYGWTPLMRASNLGRLGTAKILLAKGGADVNAFNTRGQTAMHLAAAGEFRKLYQVLLAAGGNPDLADFKGRTPREIALAVGLQ
ncbi:MAG: ankyrin repeat domain-containing protein [Burkholderiaceae bacterium]